jgi:hypothetical protein
MEHRIQVTRSGRLVRPPAVPRLPLPPEETDDEELDPTYVEGEEDSEEWSSSSSEEDEDRSDVESSEDSESDEESDEE